MPKLILLLTLGILAYLLLRALGPAAKRRDADKPRGGPPRAERMVACARCGVFVPESESLAGEGGRFCSEEHRRLGST
ncbi:MAG TPA: PP0621 family protein [Candidatus Desulfobacillus sp.]|nr:PP0621 family protein [Candidatus Desulfobacillus sp.]